MQNSSAVLLPINTVIFSSRATIGDVCINKVPTCTNQGYKNFVCNSEKIHYEYLYYIMKNQARNIAELASGMTYPEISKSTIFEYKIPLPPMDIQKKIVDGIEVIEKNEEASLVAIKANKNEIEVICSQIYSQYSKKPLEELAITNPSKDEISDMDLETLVSFIDMASVSNDGYIVTKIDKRYGDVKKGSYTYFKEGDIIIAKITPCMENGKCALAQGLTNGVALGSSEFHVIRSNDDLINIKYLFTILNRNEVRMEAAKNMTGASGHRRVPIAFYERLEIPVPSMKEQQKIVIKIEKLEAEIQNLQKQQEQMKKQKEQVLKKYL
jgi:restriction endonuclease S subunit